MSITTVTTPTSHLRFGIARADITPPVGMYHPMWGAARHQRATGVHRPLTGEAMVFAPLTSGDPHLRIQLDHIGLEAAQEQTLVKGVSQASGVASERIIVTYSHSHSTGNTSPDRIGFAGGELIEPYLQDLYHKMTEAAAGAVAAMQECVITYATGHCTLAANRDYWDEANGIRTCGYNPGVPADATVQVARMTRHDGRLLATLVNYACHPTTLAWENTLISPDYIGAMRQVVEEATDAPCVFALGACGELGAVRGHQGDTAIADANGRQLGYAALSALAALGEPAHDFVYSGPVVSGATLGTWAHRPLSLERQAEAAILIGGNYVVDLPKKPRPNPAEVQAEMEVWLARQRDADQQGDAVAARNAGARAERARRWLLRISHLSDSPTYPFHFAVYRMGDAFWVTVGGEPYSLLQSELRQRFPEYALIVSPLAGELQVAYLLDAESYGTGRYQEEPSILARGCLEVLIEAVAARIEALRSA